jgi:hypothetical protein
MPLSNPEQDKRKALYAVDPLVPLDQLDPATDLIDPDTLSLLVLMVCEVPEESLALFRKRLVPPSCSVICWISHESWNPWAMKWTRGWRGVVRPVR